MHLIKAIRKYIRRVVTVNGVLLAACRAPQHWNLFLLYLIKLIKILKSEPCFS